MIDADWPCLLISFPGYDERSVLHVCSGQIKDLACEINEFMWVHSVIIGYSPTDPSGCKISATDDCQANLIDHDYWRATSYQRYSLVTVPVRTVTCGDFTVQHANYVIITYNCVSGKSIISQSVSQSLAHLLTPHAFVGFTHLFTLFQRPAFSRWIFVKAHPEQWLKVTWPTLGGPWE